MIQDWKVFNCNFFSISVLGPGDQE